MERINSANTQIYEPAEVLVSVREPYNKNTFWIHPHDDVVESKIYNKKGWLIISTTKDEGLSKISLDLITELLENLQESIQNKMTKHFNKYSAESKVLYTNQKEFSDRLDDVELKLDKLIKRLLKLIVSQKDGK